MAEVYSDIVVRYSQQGVDEINAFHQKLSQHAKQYSETAIRESKKSTDALVANHSGYIKEFQKLEQLKVQYAGQSSEQIKAHMRDLSEQIRKEDERVTTAKSQSAKDRASVVSSGYTEELKSLRILLQSKTAEEAKAHQLSAAKEREATESRSVARKLEAEAERNARQESIQASREQHQKEVENKKVASQQARELHLQQVEQKKAAMQQARADKKTALDAEKQEDARYQAWLRDANNRQALEKKAHDRAEIQSATERNQRIKQQDQSRIAARNESDRKATANFKSYSELEVQYHGVSTKHLVHDINELLNAKYKMHDKSLQAATEAERHEAALEEKAMNRTLHNMYRLSQQREEVQHRGAGAIFNQLGIGRGIFEIGRPLEGFEELTAGLRTAALATAGVLALTEALKLGKEAFHAIEGAARKYESGNDRLAISLTRSGLAGRDLDRMVELMGKHVDDLSVAFARPRDEIAETMATVAAFSRTGGEKLTHLTELTIGISEAMKLPLEETAKLIGKVADPEVITNAASRYGIIIDKKMTQVQRIKALEDQYGATIEETKRRMDEGVHSWDQLTNKVSIAAEKFALKAFRELSPTFKELKPKIDVVFDGLSEIKLGPGIERVGKLIHFGVELGKAFDPTYNYYTRWILAQQGYGKTAQTQAFDDWKANSDKTSNAFGKSLRDMQDALAESDLSAKLIVPVAPNTKEKAGAKETSNAALYETIRARKWLRDKDEEENKKLARNEYEEELSFLNVSKLHRAAELELEVTDKHKAAKQVYESGSMYLNAELETAKKTYTENSDEYRKFVAQKAEFDFQYSLTTKRLQIDDANHALTLNKQLEDKRASLIKDKTERELEQEKLRHDRAEKDAAALPEAERTTAQELEKLTHEESIARIRADALEAQQKGWKDLAETGIHSANSELEKFLATELKLGGLANTLISKGLNKLTDLGIESLFAPKKKPKTFEIPLFPSRDVGVPDLGHADVADDEGLPEYQEGGSTNNPKGKIVRRPDGAFKAWLHPNEIVVPRREWPAESTKTQKVNVQAGEKFDYYPEQPKKEPFDISKIMTPSGGAITERQASEQSRRNDKEFGGASIDGNAGFLDPIDYGAGFFEGAGKAGVRLLLKNGIKSALTAEWKSIGKEELKEVAKGVAKEGIKSAFAKEGFLKTGAQEYAQNRTNGDDDYSDINLSGNSSRPQAQSPSPKPEAAKLSTKETVQNTVALASLTKTVATNNKLIGGDGTKALSMAGGGLGILSKLTKEAEGGPLGIIGSIFGALAGFDDGIDARVGGKPGKDNNIVMLRASSDERINVYRPAPSHAPSYAASNSIQASGPSRMHQADAQMFAAHISNAIRGIQFNRGNFTDAVDQGRGQRDQHVWA